jgi:hypothetical protein
MSNPTTNYRISTGQDLSGIFQPLSLGSAYPTPTGYTTKINGVYKDFNTIFAAYTTGAQATATGYKVGNNDLSTIFAKYNPVPYTTNGASTLINGYYLITFTNPNSAGGSEVNYTFTPLINISNISIICVGGGGGGGSGKSTSTTSGSGRGGGGGGNIQLTNQTYNMGTYTITVSTGGIGGPAGTGGNTGGNGSSGGVSSILNPSGTVILQCSGGGGGSAGGNISSPGAAGTVTIGGTGGSGGGGGINLGNGGNSSSYTTPFSIPSVLTSYINSQYCGGGGGSDANQNGGGSGYNGLGGAFKGSSNRNGENASSYGGGGGGAGNDSPTTSNYTGGYGANGVIYIYFPI